MFSTFVVRFAAPSRLFSLLIFCLLSGNVATAATPPPLWQASGPEGGNVTSLAISPDGRLFAGTREGQLFRRDPATRRWSRVGENLGVKPVEQIIVSPDPNRLFVRTLPDSESYESIFRTSDAGSSFLPRLALAHNLVLDPTNPSVLYAGVYPTTAGAARIAKSTDAGLSWQLLAGSGLKINLADALAIDPRHPQTLYAGGSGEGYGAYIFKTIDGGVTWTALPANPFSNLIKIVVDPDTDGLIYALGSTGADIDLFVSNDAGSTWSRLATSRSSFQDFALDPSHHSRVFIAGREGTYRTNDQSGSLQKLDGRRANTVLVDPKTPDVVYSGLEDGGVLKSDDAGLTWVSTNDDLVARVIGTVAVAPSAPAVVYAGGDYGIFKSTDNGQNWGDLVTIGTGGPVGHIAVDAPDPNSVYVQTPVALFHSADGGLRWDELLNKDHSKQRLSDLALDPLHPGTVWLTAHGDYDSAISGAILKSTDGGRSFNDVTPASIQVFFVSSVTLDPNEPSTAYVGVGLTVLRTRDGGATWQALRGLPDLGGLSVTAVAVDSRQVPSSIYVGTSRSGVLRSDDRGDSWQPINNGLPVVGHVQVTALTSTGGRLFVSFGEPNANQANPGKGKGLFESTDGGETWSSVQDHLGRVAVSALAGGADRVYAATLGAGVATMQLVQTPHRRPARH